MDDEWRKFLKEQLEKLGDKQDKMNTTLVKNTEHLKEHMRRTELLEQKVEKEEVRVDRLESVVDKVKGSWKLIVCIGTLIGVYTAYLKLGA